MCVSNIYKINWHFFSAYLCPLYSEDHWATPLQISASVMFTRSLDNSSPDICVSYVNKCNWHFVSTYLCQLYSDHCTTPLQICVSITFTRLILPFRISASDIFRSLDNSSPDIWVSYVHQIPWHFLSRYLRQLCSPDHLTLNAHTSALFTLIIQFYTLSPHKKIVSNILLPRWTTCAQEIIGDHQSGFRRNRSTAD